MNLETQVWQESPRAQDIEPQFERGSLGDLSPSFNPSLAGQLTQQVAALQPFALWSVDPDVAGATLFPYFVQFQVLCRLCKIQNVLFFFYCT